MQVSADLASHPIFRTVPSLAIVPPAGGVIPPPFGARQGGCSELVSLLRAATTIAVPPALLQEAINIKSKIDLAVAGFGPDPNLQQLAAALQAGFGGLNQRLDTLRDDMSEAVDDLVIAIDDLGETTEQRFIAISAQMEAQHIRSTNPARALAHLPIVVPRHLGRPLPLGVPGEFASIGAISNTGTAVMRGMIAYYLEVEVATLPAMQKAEMIPVVRRLLGLDSVIHT